MGIEPTWPAWKAGALPLSYTRFRGTKEIVSEIGVLSIPQMEFCFISFFSQRGDALRLMIYFSEGKASP